MKVKDLVGLLEKLDGDLKVVCYLEKDNDVKLFCVESASMEFAELSRSSSRAPIVKFTGDTEGRKIALIELTDDF
ncbi:hypothetical protein [Pseudomonas aeruginosa]|uniref:hypothetical protein n=1 Tax=Pseudomonas aeruginosa TaxID=287 RepID=UPI0011BF8B1A|nr:hypothetical protein [Pseudomonas aeruginosa]HBO2999643.1 hypothetical protein [Pseudomonas aeruginosa]HCF5988998.1 hypothetical protein [Pseudomonas aeruginosa]